MPALPNAGLGRRLLSLVYESLIVLAVLLIGDLLLLLAVDAAREPEFRPVVQLYLVAVVGAYFVGFWCAGGQTLPMKTWRIRVVGPDGGAVSWRRALVRYLVALASLLLPSLLWALVDRDGQFLHDRLAGTRIVQLPKSA
ncbi:MAG: RDD family protein [Pseudomonadota bacterium]